MAVTTHRNWTYPDEFEDPFWTSFSTMVQSIDDEIHILANTASTTFASVYSLVDQDVSTGLVDVKVQLEVEAHDHGNNFSSDSYTVPSSGIYLIHGSVRFSSALTAYTQIFYGGVLAAQNQRETGAAGNIPVSAILECSSGALIDLYCLPFTTCQIKGNAYQTSMQVIKIGL